MAWPTEWHKCFKIDDVAIQQFKHYILYSRWAQESPN